MRTLFTTSDKSTFPTTSFNEHQLQHSSSSSTEGSLNTESASFSSPPSLTFSSPDNSLLSRHQVKPKPSLRSIGLSEKEQRSHNDGSDGKSLDTNHLVRPSLLHRLSPGLAARVKLLDGHSSKTGLSSNNQNHVGRISEEHLKEIDNSHQNNHSIIVERKGKAWSGIQSSRDHRGEGSVVDLCETAPAEEALLEPVEEPLVTLTPEQIVASTPNRAQAIPTEESRPSSGNNKETVSPAAAMSTIESALAMLRSDAQDEGTKPESQTRGQTDFEKYLQSSVEANGRSTLGNRSIPSRSSSVSSLHRTESIFSFSRSSFSSQLSQLTSIALPQPTSLAASIAAIPNAAAAIKQLIRSAEQMHVWIRKASKVLTGLYAEDDVEWAAAGGRDGLDGVDRAIARFESVVNVYVKSIEDVQTRPDISEVDPEQLRKLLSHMEVMLNEWADIKFKLGQVKEQVELAMEWEELWDNVLGDVGSELDYLNQLVFEMEEKRHVVAEEPPAIKSPNNGLDISDLGTIVEEAPGETHANKRFSIGPIISSTPATGTPMVQTPQNDTSLSDLTALFARMQPLRASLDFLPMRLSMFLSRAGNVFPGACEELEERNSRLESSFQNLEADAESIRKELGEDRWVRVFRSASGQACKMFESVEKSIGKVQEAIEAGAHLHNTVLLTKRIDNYEAKKQHYVPAIDQVISIIQKGTQGRLTVNGEILRSLSEMKKRFDALKTSIKVMDSSLEEDINTFKAQHMQDSTTSSILTVDSPAAGSVDTSGSSPASSDVMTPGTGRRRTSSSKGTSSRRASSVASATRSTVSKVKRYSGIPQMSAALSNNRKSSLPKPPSQGTPTPSSVRSTTPSSTSLTPASAVRGVPVRQSPSPMPSNRPRWNGSTNTSSLDVGHNFKPLSVSMPSPYAKNVSTPTMLPTPRRPLSVAKSFSQESLRSLGTPQIRPTSRTTSRMSTRAPLHTRAHSSVRGASPSPIRSSILDPPPYGKRRGGGGQTPTPTNNNLSTSHLDLPPRNSRSRLSYNGVSPSFSKSAGYTEQTQRPPPPSRSPARTPRPESSFGHSKRISLLPLPKGRATRESSIEPHSRKRIDERPPWR